MFETIFWDTTICGNKIYLGALPCMLPRIYGPDCGRKHSQKYLSRNYGWHKVLASILYTLPLECSSPKRFVLHWLNLADDQKKFENTSHYDHILQSFSIRLSRFLSLTLLTTAIACVDVTTIWSVWIYFCALSRPRGLSPLPICQQYWRPQEWLWRTSERCSNCSDRLVFFSVIDRNV